MPNERPRCGWAGGPDADPLMVEYHDLEWGTPVTDDTELFERLALESFQAGLSWSTILRKREAFRAAFRGFDPRVVAAFDDDDRTRLMADAGIVRNGAKIDATIGNAGAFLARRPRPARSTPISRRSCPRRRRSWRRPRLRRDPRHDAGPTRCRPTCGARGFRFVGSTIVYAFMQSVGLVDDHVAELLPVPRSVVTG